METVISSERKFSKFLPKHSKKSAFWWVLQRITGVMLFFLVLFHMIMNHYLSATIMEPSFNAIVEEFGLASFQAVQWKMINFPLYFLVSILFVLTVVFHMLNGFRTVTLDLAPGKMSKRVVAIGLLLIGFALVVYAFLLNSTVMVA